MKPGCEEKEVQALLVKGMHLSYNPEIGDEGATLLASAFPASHSEFGLAACGIGDQGGASIHKKTSAIFK